MRFKSTRFEASLPTINLTPMLNVVMVVLAFFVLVSMTLTSEPNTVDVSLPGKEGEAEVPPSPAEPPPILKVQVNSDRTLAVDGVSYSKEQILVDTPVYLSNNPEATVAVIPEAEASYEQVIQLLVELRKVGGDRVSLAVGGSGEETEETEETVEEVAEPSPDEEG